MGKESKLERRLKVRAESRGFLFLKLTSPGCVGMPDRGLFGYNEVIAFMELKQPGGKLSAPQERRIQQFRDRGFQVHVVDTYEQGARIIDELAEIVEMRLPTLGISRKYATKH